MKVILTIEEKEKILNFLRNGINTLTEMSLNSRRNFIKRVRNYVLVDEKLYYKTEDNSYKLVVADDDISSQLSLFNQLHLPDHTGMKAMYERSKRLFIGFKREKINEFVANCITCNRHRPLQRISPITPIISQHPWELIQMDCIDLRNYSHFNDGYGWIVNILDCYSKFMFPVPVISKTAENIKYALRQNINREGSPRIIQTDNGKEFNNSLFSSYLNELNIEFKRGRPRHPQNQGQVERANQTLVRKIAKYLSNKAEKRWIDILPDVVFKYNTTWHRAINKSPMEAFRGRQGFNTQGPIERDSEEIEELDEDLDFIANLEYVENPRVENMNISESNLKVEGNIPILTVNSDYRDRYIQRMQQDADVHFHNIAFNPGDFVLLQKDFDTNLQTRRRKMDDFYEEGTYIILERVGSNNFKIQKRDDTSIIKTVGKNRLKKINS